MNGRLKELAIEAAGKGFDTFFTSDFDSQAKIQKFALLIIQEYEKLLPDSCPWAGADQEGPMKGWHVQHVARRHFGIEE